MDTTRIFELTNFEFVGKSAGSRKGSIYLKGCTLTGGLPDSLLLEQVDEPSTGIETLDFDLIESHPYAGHLISPAPVGIIITNIELPNIVDRIRIRGEGVEIIRRIDLPRVLPMEMPATIFNYCIKHKIYVGDACPHPPPHM